MSEPMPRKLPKYCVEDVDRYDTSRVYLRRKGFKKLRLHGVPWSKPFMDAYETALAGVEKQPLRKATATDGTWRWLCQQYIASAAFRKLDKVTRARRRPLLEATFEEPTKPGATMKFGDVPIPQFSVAAVRAIRDRKAEVPHGANNTLKAIRAVFKWATSLGVELAHHNPARDVPMLTGDNDSAGFHTWTDDEVLAFIARHERGSRAYVAMMLMMFGGGRRSDVVALGRQHVRDGWLRYTLHKNRNTKAIQIEIPLHPALADALLTVPTTQMTFLMTEQGRPFTSNGFGNWFKDRCREADLPHCSAHGIRKAAASIAAEEGASTNQLMALFGWLTAKMAEHYTKAADRRKMAKAGSHYIRIPAARLDTSGNIDEIPMPYKVIGAQERGARNE